MSPEILLIAVIILAAARLYTHLNKNLKMKEETLKNVNEYLDSLIMAGATALVLITFVIRTFYIPSSSMVPTLKINDFIMVNKFVYSFYNPARGDIVVFHPPEKANAGKREFIKRIVAVEGDTVEVRGGILYINDVAQDEKYILEPIFYDMEKVTVPKDSYFAMGDNRNNSDDSHIWGFLPRKNLVGKAVWIFFPFNRMRTM